MDKEFFRYALNSRLSDMIGRAQGGVGLAHITKGKFESTSVLIPPLPEQRRIVARIEELQARTRRVREALEAIPPLLERFRQSVLAAFRGDLAADWRSKHPDVEPTSVLLEHIRAERRQQWEEAELVKLHAKGKVPKGDGWKQKYQEPEPVDTERLPELPEGWAWTSINELSEVVRGASPRPAGDPTYFNGRDTPWITVGEITKDEEIYLTGTASFLTSAGRERSRYIRPGTLLLTNSGATLGVPKITKIGGCINDGSVALLGLDDRLQLYLYIYLKSQTNALRTINQGAAQPNLNTDIVREIRIPLAPPNEQEQIIASLLATLSKISHQDGASAESSTAFDRVDAAILSKAFRGELVPQDPNDEPASVLLERIRQERSRAQPKGGRRART